MTLNLTQPKVLYFSTYVSHESGASHALRETIRRVTLFGVKPVVVVPDCPDSHEMFPSGEFDVTYIRLERPRNTLDLRTQSKYLCSFLPTLAALRRVIRTKEVDLVHFNEITDFIAGIAGASCRTPSVCHVRHDGLSKLYRRTLIPMLRKTVEAVIVPSKSTEAWLRSEDKELAKKIHLVPDYAFDIREFDTPGNGDAFRRELGISPETILVVLVSKLVVPKGHRCFIEAAAEVAKTSKNIQFVVVGGPIPDREEEAAGIRAFAESLISPSIFRFVGMRRDLPEIFSASDIAVHCPVYPDTYPTVVLLAMVRGKPVIGSDIGGIPEQIIHNRTGVLIPPSDPHALAEAILELAEDPARRRALGESAERALRTEFAPEKQGELIAGLYAKVLNSTHRKRPGSRKWKEAAPELASRPLAAQEIQSGSERRTS